MRKKIGFWFSFSELPLNSSDYLGETNIRLLKDILPKIDNSVIVYCVLDTDCIETTNFDTLLHNVKMLKSICPRNIFLLIQNKNFEDELLYVLDCKNLCDKFNLKNGTQKDLKKNLAQSVSYSRIISKKNLVRYCRRPEDFKTELKNKAKNHSKEKLFCLSRLALKNELGLAFIKQLNLKENW